MTGNDIARWERGKRIPRPEARRALEEILQLPVLYLDRAAAVQRALRATSAAEPINIAHPSDVATASQVEPIRAALLDTSDALVSDAGEVEAPLLRRLDDELANVMRSYQDARFDRMLGQLPDVLRSAHAAAQLHQGRKRRQARCTLALASQAAAMVLTKVGEYDLAWIASERGLRAAEEVDDVAVFASLRRSAVHSLQSQGRSEASTRLAERTAEDLRSSIAGDAGQVREVSVYGTLLLAGSMAAARQGDSSAVTDYLDEADYWATQLGHKREPPLDSVRPGQRDRSQSGHGRGA